MLRYLGLIFIIFSFNQNVFAQKHLLEHGTLVDLINISNDFEKLETQLKNLNKNHTSRVFILTNSSNKSENFRYKTTLIQDIIDIVGKDKLYVETGLIMTSNLSIKVLDMGVHLNIYFDFDDDKLSKEGIESLTTLADFWKNKNQVNLIIRAYTDSTGDAAYNLNLSQKRAEQVLQKLESLGVIKAHLQMESFGVNHPQYPQNSNYSKLNRRVEIIRNNK